MKNYLDLARLVLEKGIDSKDRTNTGTKSIFGASMRFNLQKGFPLVTTKKIFLKSVIHELLFFIKGECNNNYLKDRGVNIWTPWALDDGSLGPIYGKQWRSWPSDRKENIDQLKNAIEKIKTNPYSRRIIVNSWNVSYLPDESITHEENIKQGKMVLPPCHTLFQFYVRNNCLSCSLLQRSADVFIGLPFNIASYALLTHLVASVCNLSVGDFVWFGGDVHIYHNHIEAVKTQLKRQPLMLPCIKIKQRKEIDEYQYEDITLENYNYHPFIKGAINV